MLGDQTYPKRPRRLGPSSHRPRARRPPLSTFQHEPWKIRNFDYNVSGIQILHTVTSYFGIWVRIMKRRVRMVVVKVVVHAVRFISNTV